MASLNLGFSWKLHYLHLEWKSKTVYLNEYVLSFTYLHLSSWWFLKSSLSHKGTHLNARENAPEFFRNTCGQQHIPHFEPSFIFISACFCSCLHTRALHTVQAHIIKTWWGFWSDYADNGKRFNVFQGHLKMGYWDTSGERFAIQYLKRCISLCCGFFFFLPTRIPKPLSANHIVQMNQNYWLQQHSPVINE